MYTEDMQGTQQVHATEYAVAQFAQDLIEQGVCHLEIVWGNYKEYFAEVPEHLRGRYLRYRKTMLHRQALAVVLYEESVFLAHPFSS